MKKDKILGWVQSNREWYGVAKFGEKIYKQKGRVWENIKEIESDLVLSLQSA